MKNYLAHLFTWFSWTWIVLSILLSIGDINGIIQHPDALADNIHRMEFVFSLALVSCDPGGWLVYVRKEE
jgi:hypothetical protein